MKLRGGSSEGRVNVVGMLECRSSMNFIISSLTVVKKSWGANFRQVPNFLMNTHA